MHITPQCPVCSSAKLEGLKDYVFRFPGEAARERIDLTSERLWILFERVLRNRQDARFQVMLCGECGFIFTNPRFDEADIGAKYQAIVELGLVKRRMEKKPPSNLSERAKRVHGLISQYVSAPNSKPDILDYGGASGYILEPFRKDWNCFILDYEKWDLPAGITYLGKDLSDLTTDRRFDVILLLHTLEHVIEPRKYLQSLCGALKPGGMLYVEVPLGAFREWQMIREPLTHLNYFSEESLFKCAKLCGLQVVHISSAYQWVTHGKMWCLNLIGANPAASGGKEPQPLTTRSQINRLTYYGAYLNRELLGKLLRKLRMAR